jgi:hypothetical protein
LVLLVGLVGLVVVLVLAVLVVLVLVLLVLMVLMVLLVCRDSICRLILTVSSKLCRLHFRSLTPPLCIGVQRFLGFAGYC